MKPVLPEDIKQDISTAHSVDMRGNPQVSSSRKQEAELAEHPRPHILWRGLSLALRALTPLLVLAMAFKGYAWLKETKPKVPKKKRAEQVWPVKTRSVVIQDVRPVLRVFGETLAGRKVDLRSLVAGKVLKVGKNLREGAVVEEGEFLLQIDPFAYEGAVIEARSAIREARARMREIEAAIKSDQDARKRTVEQLKIAEKDYNRALKLAKRGTVTRKLVDDRRLVVSQRKQAVDQFKNSLIVQQARLETQRATLARLEWGLKRAQRNLQDTRLTAPYKAYVSNVGTNIGQVIGVNDKVATLLDKDWMEVRFVLSDRQYGRLVRGGNLVGKQAEVIWDVGEKPLRFSAVIRRVGARVNSENGGVEVFARLLDPDKSGAIRAGAFVEVMLHDTLYEKVIRLPQTAVYGRKTIYVIEKERLKSRPVEVLAVVGADVLVRGALKPGEQVVTNKLSFAGDGVKVKAVSVGGSSR